MKRLLSIVLFAVALTAALVSCKKDPIVLKAPSVTGVTADVTTAEVAWSAVENAGGYVLQLRTVGGNWADATTTSSTSASLTGLQAATDYEVRVMAKASGAGFQDSDYSAAYKFTTGQDVITLATPVITSVVPAARSAVITWTAVEKAENYVLEISTADGSRADMYKYAETSVTIEKLKPATEYKAHVRAIAEGAESSPFSDIYNFSTTEVTFSYPLTLDNADDFVVWINEKAADCTADNVITLGADMDLSSKEIHAVDTFNGVLDGNNHSIKGLSTSAPLFKVLTGTVQNLVIEGAVSQTVAEDESGSGHPLAALAIISKGKVINCVNKASVTLTGAGILGSPVVAGLVAYQEGGEFSGNKNFGEIKLQHGGTANVAIAVDDNNKFNRKPFSVIGGVVGVVVSATVSECENEGTVSVACSDPSKVSARHYVGGVIGTPQDARVLKCTNKGAVSADFTDSAKSAAKQVWVGGIIGGRNGDEKTVDGAYVEDCQNYGELTLIAENSVNNYLAGIGGQATVEATGSNYSSDASTIQKIVNCHNHGKLVKKGAGGCRLGGISGGAATLENCSNDGEIVVENITAAGAVGGLVGYPTQAYHPVTGCKNTGKMTANCDVAFAFGGLFGQGGNTNQNYADCTVNCEMNAPATVLCGIILGTAKTIASGKAITYGTASEPFKVAGSIRGVALDAENYKSMLVGDGGVTAGGTINVDNVVFGK